MQTPSFMRRLASFLYDLLLLVPVLFVASFIPLVASLAVFGRQPDLSGGLFMWLFYLYLLGGAGIYFTWSWRRGGQTLAMKTWRIRVVAASGRPVGGAQAWLRYVLALVGLAAGGLGFLWALFDADRQFLHDRLAGTRLVVAAA